MADANIDILTIDVKVETKDAKKDIKDLESTLEKVGSKTTGRKGAENPFDAMGKSAEETSKKVEDIGEKLDGLTTALGRVETAFNNAEKAKTNFTGGKSQKQETEDEIALEYKRLKAIEKRQKMEAYVDKKTNPESTEAVYDRMKAEDKYQKMLDYIASKRKPKTTDPVAEEYKALKEADKRQKMLDYIASKHGGGDAKNGANNQEATLESIIKRAEEAKKKIADLYATMKPLAKVALFPITKPLQLATRAATALGRSIGKLLPALKRVAVYRAIRFALRAITDGFREGTQNAYQWSKALGGTFAASMDMLATSSLYLKNSLGALATPLINAVAPAIDFIIDKFVALLNVANQVIALLTGAKTWTKAIKYPKEYADAANQAAGGAGKLAKALTTILAIDELNPLNGDKGSGGGGGGGSGSALDYSQMFEEVDVASKSLEGIFEPFVNAWKEKGQGVIDAFHNALDGIDQVIHAIGNSFAEVWQNGTGQATVEHLLGILTGILNTIGNIGTAFAEAWNEDNVGTQIIQNIWDMVNEILEMWDDIANETAEWAKSLDFGPILQSFESLTGALKPLVSLITDSLSWAWTNVLLPLGKWTIEEAAPVLIDTLATALETLGLVAEKIAPYLKPVWDNFLSKLASLTGGAWLSTLESLRDVLKDINDALSGEVSVGDWVEALIKDGFKSLQKLYYIGVGVKALFGEYNYAKAVKYLGMAIGINDDGAAPGSVGSSAAAVSGAAPSMGELQVDVKGNLVGLISDKLTEKQKQVPTTADINKSTIDPTVKDSLTKTSMIATLTGSKYGDGVKAQLTKTSMTPTLASPLYAKGVKSSLTKTGMTPTLSSPLYASGVESKLTKTTMEATLTGGSPTTLDGYNSRTKKLDIPSYANFNGWGYTGLSGYNASSQKVQFPSYANFGAWGYSGLSGYHSSNSRVWFPSYALFDDYDTTFTKVKMALQITEAYGPNGNRVQLKENGGAFYGGKWHDIAQYATGGIPSHGSLYIAGEAGSELVGHIGGRTEVLNQSQIASTIAAATQMSNASQNSILVQLLNVAQQIYEGQGDVRAYIPAGEVVSGLQRNNRRDGRALVPMGV